MPYLTEHDHTIRQEPSQCDHIWWPMLWSVVLIGWFVVLVLLSVLLSGDNTLEVNGLCGALWPFMLFRTVCFGAEWLLEVAAFLGFESMMRNCIYARPNNNNNNRHDAKEAGCLSLFLGVNDAVRWFGVFMRFVVNAAFGLAGLVVVPRALVDPAPCCVNALSATSFTGTYTLGVLAWLLVVLDCMQGAARGTWLVMRHGDVREYLAEEA